MIEAIVLRYLIQQNIEEIGDNIYMEVPEDPPDRYILIEKTGSGRENRIDNATITIQSISRKSLLEAAKTNYEVKQAMEVFAEKSAEIFSCKPDSDYNFTNPNTKEYRYQAVFNIFY